MSSQRTPLQGSIKCHISLLRFLPNSGFFANNLDRFSKQHTTRASSRARAPCASTWETWVGTWEKFRYAGKLTMLSRQQQ